MTVLDREDTVPGVDFGIYDADQHYYEATDAITRHLPREHRQAVRWVDIDGRRSLLIGGKLLGLIPNPTYDPVGVPGSLEVYFRSQNVEGRELRDIVEMHAIQPEYRDRDARIARLDAQGVEFAWLMPSLGLGVEQMLVDQPAALNAVISSYNTWLDEDWGYARDNRIQTAPLISFVDPVAAAAELDTVIARGARMIVLRPAPVANPGLPKSLGDPMYDHLWARIADADLNVVFHAADSGYGAMIRAWGEDDQFTGMKQSPLTEVMSIHIERPIFDTMAALVCHGVFDRFPTLRVASLELGAGWAPELVRRFRAAYGKTPQLFGRDPVESFREHVWVAPFYEDDLTQALEALGEDRIMLGSDWPHPEGLPTPGNASADFAPLGPGVLRKALRENLKTLAGV